MTIIKAQDCEPVDEPVHVDGCECDYDRVDPRCEELSAKLHGDYRASML